MRASWRSAGRTRQAAAWRPCPGSARVGPVIATAPVASIDDGGHLRSGRELAAWIGLVPRQYATGGKAKLGGIGRQANHYLRRQMIHGARSVLFVHQDRTTSGRNGCRLWLSDVGSTERS